MKGLADRSRRPRTSPNRVVAEVEALTCELRRQHPRWGARRISHELGRRGVDPAPSRATVHRMLVRNGLVDPQAQQHKRKYKRWQRAEPMHLWQMDIVGGVPVADGRSCKLVTGIDDHSRFVVVATVVAVPSGRAICAAFTQAMRRYGVPSEVLTDNGGQFTGRYVKPQPVEVMFERICRENGIKQRLTKPASPTTTGEIERLHRTLREEFLDHVAPFESPAAAQAAIDAWVESYNHRRPHQALDMATPASQFRPNGPTRLDTGKDTSGDLDEADTVEDPPPGEEEAMPRPAAPTLVDVIEPAALIETDGVEGAAVEFPVRVPPSGQLTVRSGRQTISLHESMAGRPVTIWADLRSVHVIADGHVVRTVASRMRPEDLRHLAMRGARPAGPPPAKPALRRQNGTPVLPDGGAVEIERTVTKDGKVSIAGTTHLVGFAWAGRRITLRLDGHLMHAIAEGALIGSWPCPITSDRLARIPGARTPSTPLPPPPLPAGSPTRTTESARQRTHHGRRPAPQTRSPPPRQTGHRRHRGHPPTSPARRRRDRRPPPPRSHTDHPTPCHWSRGQPKITSSASRRQTDKHVLSPHTDISDSSKNATRLRHLVQIRGEEQLNPVADEVSAITAVVRPILSVVRALS
jgi:transposase InsO family protein